MSITGNLKTLEFAELLQWLAQGHKTGALVIRNGSVDKRIYFSEGKIISSESDNPEEHLGNFLIREGLIDEATLSRALKLQESTQILLGKVLVTLGTISEDELHRILQRKTEESLYELFNWTEGEFHFVPDDLPRLPMVPLEIDVTNVVLEGAKRFDEARRDQRNRSEEYSDEIENVLSADIFHGVDLEDEEEIAELTEPMGLANPGDDFSDSQEPSAGETGDEDSSPAVPGYYSGAYSGASRTRPGRAPLLAAAAAVAAVAIGVSAYFFMRPDPAVGIADRESLENAVQLQPTERFSEFAGHSTDRDAADSDGDGITGSELPAVEPPSAKSNANLDSQSLRARYEAELQALKQQLAEARLAAAERDQAMGRLAELEEQVSQADSGAAQVEPSSPPTARYSLASLQNPLEDPTLSAGGDELPPLGTPQQTTEADQEAGADFAADMVDSLVQAGPSPWPDAIERDPSSRPEPVEGEAIESIAPTVSSPVMLAGPKPRYPPAAMRLRKEAVVNLRLLIDDDGKVADVERVGPEQGLGFDKAAINAALNTRWQPGTRDGEPVEMWTQIRITFKP